MRRSGTNGRASLRSRRRRRRSRRCICGLGYFGSYARGDWGIGSDVDRVALVARCARPFAQRPLDFDTSGLPVPADLLVYIEQRRQETVWVA